jgi:hypothetical protein
VVTETVTNSRYPVAASVRCNSKSSIQDGWRQGLSGAREVFERL